MKICLLGDGAVGKTSLIRKFVYDEFDDTYLATIGTKITKKTMTLGSGTEEVNITLMISDIVGQVEFERIHKQYYRGSKAGIFVCDVTRPETLNSMNWWLDSFRQAAGNVPLMLLGNKSDLVGCAKVDEAELGRYASGFGCKHFMTSAKTGLNVERTFHEIGMFLCQAKK